MDTLKELLFEGVVSSVLYHLTNVKSAINILDENKIRLAPAYGTGSDEKKQERGKLYYLSTSRIKYSGYARSSSPRGKVNVVLDGRELGQNYTSINVDYYGKEFRDVAKEEGGIERFLKYDENEERIITNDPELDPATRYIKSLHVFVGSVVDTRPKDKKKIRSLEKMADKRDIPVYFYTDTDNWKVLKKQDAFESVRNLFGDVEADESGAEYTLFSDFKYIKGAAELIQKGSLKDLSEEGEMMYEKLKGGYSFDFPQVFKRKIHNNKNNPRALEYIKVLSKAMNKEGATTVEGLLDILVDEVKELRKEDLEDFYNKYKRIPGYIIKLYNLRDKSNIGFKDGGTALDGVTRFFWYNTEEGRKISKFKENSSAELAFKTVNRIAKLMRVGYFENLKELMHKKMGSKDTLARTLRKFVDKFIRPVILRIFVNEDYKDTWKFKKRLRNMEQED